MSFDAYDQQAKEREESGLPPRPLTPEQMVGLIDRLLEANQEEGARLVSILKNRVSPGVDPAAKVKAAFLLEVALGNHLIPSLSPSSAVELLGTMLGGYNLPPLIELLDHPELAPLAEKALGRTVFVGAYFETIAELAKEHPAAQRVMGAWAEGRWFVERPALPEKISLTVFKVDGEINTDDFSPASEAWSRPDIPLHAESMLRKRTDRPLERLAQLKQNGLPIAFVGDVVGTGSSRKSATNSLLWHIGEDIPYVPNKRSGGVCLGGKIAPIFFNTLEDAGALPIECDVSELKEGDRIDIYPYEGKVLESETGRELARFSLKTAVIPDEVRAGGRIPLIIGRALTDKAAKRLGREPADLFVRPAPQEVSGKDAFTLAQKLVGEACGVEGVLPGTYCEPVMTTVGSQDTTGPMTRDELSELACTRFEADFVMQSFCHTAAYPRKVDSEMHKTLPQFFVERGGVALKPGDGVIHSWLNRFILPNTVGTGGDSHTRFPVGISFPAGSGLVAFAAAIGMMPLDMPESVRVTFTGECSPEITLRDLVNAIPYQAIQEGRLTVAKAGKKNLFSGRILEMEGLESLSVDEAFELTDASAERSAAASTIALSVDSVVEAVRENVALISSLIESGYQDAETLKRRLERMERWLADPVLIEADTDASYAEELTVDMSAIREPLLCCPNDPDDVRTLSDVAGQEIDEVFVGSCMTHLDHYRRVAALIEGKGVLPVRLWVCPPTRMDAEILREEGVYAIFAAAGARIEMPGCSLCMGNQARVATGARVFSTSTRNFPNRMGDDAKVWLGSAELAAITALLGEIPDAESYRKLFNEQLA